MQKVEGKRKVYFTLLNIITDYICRNTIIPYLSKSGNSNTIPELIAEYPGLVIEELDQKVKNIKVVDPACGSGAFLNKAADVLIEIHKSIHKSRYKNKKNTLTPYFDNIGQRREILINNIYGVDLNEESVDITKLSLFLKVCRKDLKLPDLNIKCGNSIVDNPDFTDKSFKWEKEFPQVFAEGGFDIVIGNPPYVRHHGISKIKPYLKENYQTYKGLADLYVYFFEKGIKILKYHGNLGYISSNKFTKVTYGQPLRKFILDCCDFKKYVDHTYDDIFEDATTYPSIFILNKCNSANNNILINNDFELEQRKLGIREWTFEHPEILNLRDKINEKGVEIRNIPSLNIYIGIFTGYNDAFIIDEDTKNKLIKEDSKSLEVIKPLLRGKDIQKWKIKYNDLYLLYIPWKFPINKYPAIKNHLSKFKEKLLNRSVVKDGNAEWFALQRYAADYFNEFEKPKLIYPEIASQMFTVYDENKYFTNAKCFIITSETINLQFLGALLSSKTLNFLFKFLGTPLQGKYYNLSKAFIEQLSIYPADAGEQRIISDKAEQMLQLNNQLQREVNNFQDWINYTYKIEKVSKKLKKYYELSCEDFLNELKKKKVNVKSRENYQTLKEEFEKSITRITPLLEKIRETDYEIDQMVYNLYGLTDEEIKIIDISLGNVEDLDG